MRAQALETGQRVPHREDAEKKWRHDDDVVKLASQWPLGHRR
jgi:hypothetical protein